MLRTSMNDVKRALLAAGCVLVVGCARATPPANTPARAEAPAPAQLLEIADLLANNGERVRAGQYLILAQKRGISEQQVLPRLLKLYAEDGQYRLAIEHAEHYLRRHPEDARVRLCLASFYVAVGATPQAIREFGKLVARDPDNAEAHFALASLLHEAGIERARTDTHYRAYLALEPGGAHAEEARANLLKEVP